MIPHSENKKTKTFTGLIIGTIGLVVPFLSHAAGTAIITISPYIPGTASVGSNSPGNYIVNFYQLALMFGGILAFGAIVYGAIKYAISPGNPSGLSEARAWIQSALLGLLLLVAAYLILYTVNPMLVSLSLPSLGSIPAVYTNPAAGGGTNGTGGATNNGNGSCSAAPSGPCSVAQLQSTCLGNSAQSASEICMAESSGYAGAGGDKSTSGQPVSIGLFQINLSANTLPGLNCPAAFDHSWRPNSPSTIINPTLYAQCVAAAQNVATNIAEACALSKNGATWKAWSTAPKCGLN